MFKKLPVLFTFWALLYLPAMAQKWGYATLIAKQNSNSVQLLDTNSTVIKQWSTLSGNTGYSSYLMPGGYLWRAVINTGNSLNGGGVCGRIQKIAWDGTLLFNYAVSDANQVSHHDFCPLPNGNVILIVYEKKTAAQVQAAGATINAERWSEKLIELKPTGQTTATIVWEWHLWDHLVQNLYPAKANYQASILDHAELLNINYKNSGNMADWVHMNGIDYNSKLDQIVVSSHNLNELYVIDHSTTSAQAASHSGGNSGKGGDFLYRWGNPAAYDASGAAVFNVVHDAHWVPDDCPRAGWLGGFNNRGVSNSISSVDLFQPAWNGTAYTRTPGQAYLPATYGYRHQASGYSSNMGSSQQLPNGNMLICLATAGKVYEINPAGTQLWQYTTTGSIPQAKRYERCFIENPTLAIATPGPTLCSGSGSTPLGITPSATNVNAFTYHWAPSMGLSADNVQNPVVSGITQNTAYTVTVTTAGGCTATASIPVTVTPPPPADAGADVNILPGQQTVLTATGGVSYQWSTGVPAAAITVNPSQHTVYTVTVTDANGCTASDEVSVNLLPAVMVSAQATPNAICPGAAIQLDAIAVNGSGNYTYLWNSIPAGFTSSLRNPLVSPTQNTEYVLMVSDGFGVATATANVVVLPVPAADAGNDVSVTWGQSVALTASGGVSYFWNNGANTAQIVVQPDMSTTYTVTVTNVQGCTATDQVTVTVTNATLGVSIAAGPLAVCPGSSLQLTAAPIGGTGLYSFTWSADGVEFSTEQNPVFSPSVSTLFTVVVSDGQTSASASRSVDVYPATMANAGADQNIQIGTTALLTASGGNQYVWNTGASDPSIEVRPLSDMHYTVTVTDEHGCTGTDEVNVTVFGSLMTANIGALQLEICSGGSTQLTAEAAGGSGIYVYEWSAGGAIFSTDPNPVISPDLSTTYTAVIRDGITTFTGNIIVKVNSLPLADAGNNQNIVTGSSTTLTASGGSSYAWNTGETTASISVSPIQASVFTVTVTDVKGCSATDSVQVFVFDVLPLELSVSTPNTVICLGEVLQLVASASGGSGMYSYNWTSQPVGFSSTLPDPFINPEETTTYTVEVFDGSSTVSRNIQITVNPLAPQPTITAVGHVLISSSADHNIWFYYGNPIPDAVGQTYQPTQDGSYQVQTIGANGCASLLSEPYEYIIPPITLSLTASDTTICLGDVIQLFAVAGGGLGQYSYAWSSVPAGFVSNLPDPFVNPEVHTVYTVAVSDSLNVIVASIGIHVNPLALQPTITQSGDSLISSNPTNNQWYFYGNPIIGATDQVFHPTENGSYQVQVMDANGCFSPLSDPVEYILVGTHTPLEDSGWVIAPNPASEALFISGNSSDQPFSIEIYNSTGQTVLSARNQRQILVNALEAGFYWVRMETAAGSGLKKLIVLR